MKTYQVALGGHPEDLADGRVVAPGERVKLSDEDALEPHNARLLAEGRLMAVSDAGEKVQDRATRAEARRVANAEGGES